MKTLITTAMASYLDGLCTSGTGGQYVVIDLYQIVLLSGVTLRLASWSAPVTYNGHVYSASGPFVDRCKIKQTLKLEVSQISMTLWADPTMKIGSTPVLACIQQGLFAGAAVTVYRVISPTATPLDMSLGAVIWFVGNVAEIEELGRSHAKLSVKDPTALLSSPYPRNLYQTGCRHTLFDSGCTLSAAAYLKSGTVSAGATTVTIPTNLSPSLYPGVLAAPTAKPTMSISSVVPGVNLQNENYFASVTYVGATGESTASPENSLWVGDTRVLLKLASPPSSTGATGWNAYISTASGNEQLQNNAPIAIGTDYTIGGVGIVQGVPPPFYKTSGWFTLGQITFTSGLNSGLQRFVSQYDTPSGVATVTVMPPLPTAPVAGDSFEILPGCAKDMTTCNLKFANLAHIGATPFIPIPQQGI